MPDRGVTQTDRLRAEIESQNTSNLFKLRIRQDETLHATPTFFHYSQQAQIQTLESDVVSVNGF